MTVSLAVPTVSAADLTAADDRAALDAIDLDRAVTAAADGRPWSERAGWHYDAACRGVGPAAFVDATAHPGDPGADELGPDELGPAAAAVCGACPVRTECAVDGLRANAEGFLAASTDEVVPGYGGLTARQAWILAGLVRGRARERGITLYERSVHLADHIVTWFEAGTEITVIAATVGADPEEVRDVLVAHLARAGTSNRRIGEILACNYKWVERRRRFLGCAPGDLAPVGDATEAGVAA